MRLANDSQSVGSFPPSSCPVCAIGRGLTLNLPDQTALDDCHEDARMWWLGYHVSPDAVAAARQLAPTGHDLNFRATGVRRVGQQVWCDLSIRFDLHPLSWAVLCVDRPNERNHLADAAWEALHPDAKLFTGRLQMRRYLDLFCAEVWMAWDARPLPTRSAVS